MSQPDHLDDVVLIGVLDDELPAAESASAALHMAGCPDCSQRFQALRRLSSTIEAAVTAPRIAGPAEEREFFSQRLDAAASPSAHTAPRSLIRRLSYALAAAAAIAFALSSLPQWKRHASAPEFTAAAQPSSFQLDGETFVALPYSNPDLPLNPSHIVRMQVPVASLAQAGVVFEPISNEVSAQDRSVLADVLLGMDGQPLGVHVLASADN